MTRLFAPQTLEDIKTALHPPYSNTYFSYNRVPWQLKVRKEVFSPSEAVASPLAIHLIFCQVRAGEPDRDVEHIFQLHLYLNPSLQFFLASFTIEF